MAHSNFADGLTITPAPVVTYAHRNGTRRAQFRTQPHPNFAEFADASFQNFRFSDSQFPISADFFSMAPLIIAEALSLASFKDFIDKWA